MYTKTNRTLLKHEKKQNQKSKKSKTFSISVLIQKKINKFSSSQKSKSSNLSIFSYYCSKRIININNTEDDVHLVHRELSNKGKQTKSVQVDFGFNFTLII